MKETYFQNPNKKKLLLSEPEDGRSPAIRGSLLSVVHWLFISQTNGLFFYLLFPDIFLLFFSLSVSYF